MPPPSLVLNALLGRGVRPISSWAAYILLPLVLLLLSPLPFFFPALAVAVLIWTAPLDTLGQILTNVGNFRECIADCAPYVPGLIPYLPQLVPPIVLNLHRILPYVGDLAPYLKYLLPYPAFVAEALPKLLTRIEIMGPMISKFGPQFAKFDQRHFDKLQLVLDDMVAKCHLMVPHVDLLAPHLPEIALRADKLMPVVHYLLPHAQTMGQHIHWLIPYADVEDFAEFMPMLDKLAPHIEEFAPFGRILLPHALNPKVRKHIPILLENIDTVLPSLGATVDYLDPLIYWLSDLLPLANSVGILRSRLLLKVGAPLARFLPSVPPGEFGQAAGERLSPDDDEATAQWWRLHEAERSVTLARTRVVSGKVYFEMRIDSRYAGEFRYSALRELNATLVSLFPLKKIPGFPPRLLSRPSVEGLEERRAGLERFLVYVLSDPEIVARSEFVNFIKEKRRWASTLPVMASPLITRGQEEL